MSAIGNMSRWKVRSNAEADEGYSDISVENEDKKIGIIIELKYAENAAFADSCQEALKQIRDKNCEASLTDNGM